MRMANNDQQRRHRLQTSKAMKAIVYNCPACGRGQNKRPLDVGDANLVWSCVYCKHEWTAGEHP